MPFSCLNSNQEFLSKIRSLTRRSSMIVLTHLNHNFQARLYYTLCIGSVHVCIVKFILITEVRGRNDFKSLKLEKLFIVMLSNP